TLVRTPQTWFIAAGCRAKPGRGKPTAPAVLDLGFPQPGARSRLLPPPLPYTCVCAHISKHTHTGEHMHTHVHRREATHTELHRRVCTRALMHTCTGRQNPLHVHRLRGGRPHAQTHGPTCSRAHT
uniref:Uncharacterized protein n=1 Tax=Crocodylus porosus TaxID=8502 RepID=A0A7M4E7R0_CROPO